MRSADVGRRSFAAHRRHVQDATFDAAVGAVGAVGVVFGRGCAGRMAELRRVLKPPGELRCFDHVRSAKSWFALLENALTPLWSRGGRGCHLNRDTIAAIRATGFASNPCNGFTSAPLRFLPHRPTSWGSPPPAGELRRARIDEATRHEMLWGGEDFLGDAAAVIESELNVDGGGGITQS